MSKRRKQGDGTLRKRADGRWEARVVIGYDEKGNPITKNVTAMEKSKCLEKLEPLKEKCGVQLTGKVKAEMAFGDWLDFWYQQYAKQTLRPTTQSGYENMIYNHIIPDIGKLPLNKLTQNDLQQFYTRLKNGGRKVRTEVYGDGLSDRMVRGCHAMCRKALEKAVADGIIRINPAIGCKLPPKKAKEMQVLTREEMQRFMAQAKADGYFELFILELCTGMRRGEIVALQWDDLNMQRSAANKIEQGFGRNEGSLSEDEQTSDQAVKAPQTAKFKPKLPKIRRPGTGCITEINDHLFEGRYSPTNAYGKRTPKNVYAKTREECEEKLAELIAQMNAEIAAEKERLKAEQSA